MRDRPLFLVLTLLVLPLLGGCPQMQGIRITPDSPGDIETLLEQHEYARVRNLATRHPGIDTMELQGRIESLEAAYERDMLVEARALEDDNELLKSVELLSEALRRVPHSTALRELRTRIESRRVHQLMVNERNSLTARAEYLLERQDLYRQQANLQDPGFEARRKHAQYEKESLALSARLLEHARHALDAEELDAAGTCLRLAYRLDGNADIAALEAELAGRQKVQQDSIRKAVNVRKARIKRNTDRREKDETEKLLATTQKALNDNKLHDAREAFTRIPPSTSQDSEVIAVQNSLDQAVSTRVEHLIVTGDAQYRAEKIHEALATWSEALALDPDNVEVRERTDRANKVLANLEALKRQQRK
jgi:hypothetical protein